MVFIIISLLFFTIVFLFLEDYLGRYKWAAFLTIGFLLVLTATFRPIGFDRDSENYEYLFYHYSDNLVATYIEISFTSISGLIHALAGSITCLFFIYAFIGITTKITAIAFLSPLTFAPLAVFISNYFLLHDMTQIRASIASGIMLLIIPFIVNKRWLIAFILLFIAILFHYSAFVIAALFLLPKKKLNNVEFYLLASLIPIGYICYFLHIGISSIPIPSLQDKMDIYEELKDSGAEGYEAIKVFNPILLIKIIVFYFLLYFRDTITTFNKYFPFILSVFGLSIFAFIFFADQPILAYRISELYGIVEVIAFSNIYYTIQPTYMSKMIISLIAIFYMSLNLFYTKIFEI